MHDQVRNEKLHVWRARIKSGMFDPADLCDFASRLMDALESAEVDLARVKDVGIEAVRRAEQAEARADFANNVLQAASDCVVSGNPAEDVGLFLQCDEFDKKLLVDIATLLTRADKAEAEVERLNKALETQRNLTASAHATAQATWGGEIPSPFPGHKPPSEDAMVERFNHLNCPLCGGSGHVDDCGHDSAEAMARLTKERDWLATQLACIQSAYDIDQKTRDWSTARWAEAARRAVAALEGCNE